MAYLPQNFSFCWAAGTTRIQVSLKTSSWLQGEREQQQSGDDTYGKEKRLGMGNSWQSREGNQLHNQVTALKRMVIEVKSGVLQRGGYLFVLEQASKTRGVHAQKKKMAVKGVDQEVIRSVPILFNTKRLLFSSSNIQSHWILFYNIKIICV